MVYLVIGNLGTYIMVGNACHLINTGDTFNNITDLEPEVRSLYAFAQSSLVVNIFEIIHILKIITLHSLEIVTSGIFIFVCFVIKRTVDVFSRELNKVISKEERLQAELVEKMRKCYETLLETISEFDQTFRVVFAVKIVQSMYVLCVVIYLTAVARDDTIVTSSGRGITTTCIFLIITIIIAMATNNVVSIITRTEEYTGII